MKTIFLTFMLSMACGLAPREQAGQDQTVSTDHFTFSWNPSQTTGAEVAKAQSFCEDIYDKLANVIGEERMPSYKMMVLLEGNGMKENGSKTPPYVDRQGRIHLFKFRNEDYFEAFAHELVHAVRINRIPNWEPFFEEGLASTLADLIYRSQSGFPLFGYERSKIMAYFMQEENYISLSTLRARHRELNLKCQLRSYIPREDFFCYLRDEYGISKLLKFAYASQVGSLDLYRDVWGNSFEELESAWTQYTLSLHSEEEVQNTGEEYFTESTAKYFPPCD